MVWNYRVLWVFGIILALTTGGAGGGGGGSNRGSQVRLSAEDLRLGPWPNLQEILPGVVNALIAIGIGLACVIVIVIIVSTVARYIAETAAVRMVDHYEETGEKRSIRHGFRMGWSRMALRLFLMNLLITLPVVLAFILLFAIAAAPLLLWTVANIAGAVGTVATISLGLLVILLAIVVGVVLTALMPFFRRVCILEQVGVIESIRRGYGIVRRHLKDVAIMWLIIVGLGLGWVIAMILMTILLLVLGVVIGGLPALLVGGLARLAFAGPVPWILASVVGIPIFILIVALPLTFLSGLSEVFQSSVWTLAYRELTVLENSEPGQLPELTASDLEAPSVTQ